MTDNNYLLFYIIEKIEKSTNKNYFIKEEILDYLSPIGLFGYANNDYSLYISIVRNIIFNINYYIEKNIILQDDIKLFVNKEHIYYIQYKENYNNEFYKINAINDSIILGYTEEVINDKLNNLELIDTSNDYEDTYYVCESFTSNDIYFINPSITHCSCLAFHYSDDNKSCKHIEYFKKLNYEELNKKYIINTKNNSCNCTYFKSNSKCKHLQDFLEASSY